MPSLWVEGGDNRCGRNIIHYEIVSVDSQAWWSKHAGVYILYVCFSLPPPLYEYICIMMFVFLCDFEGVSHDIMISLFRLLI